MYILYIVAGIFIIIGIGIRYFKWYFLISGYNTMSEEKKKNVYIEGLGKLMGNFCILIGGLMIIASIAQQQGYRLLNAISLLSIFPLTIVLMVLAQKYDYNKDKSNRVEIKIVVGSMIFIGILILSILLYGIREPKVEVANGRISISGTYKTSINKEDIVEISLKDYIPKILRKTNGFDLGYNLRGNFELEDIGTAALYINEKSSPYVVIKTKNKYYIINYKDSNKTIELYNKLK